MGEEAEQYVWALCPHFTFMQIHKCLIIESQWQAKKKKLANNMAGLDWNSM